MKRFALNQATIKRASLPEAISVVARAAIPAIGLWREPLQETGVPRASRLLRDAGIRVSSLCRGGFFTMPDGAARRSALDDNRRAIDEAAAVGAPTLILVAGGLPEGSRDLLGARRKVVDALAELAPHAHQAGVTLALEPLHPMYAADRSVISTLAQALDLVTPFDPTIVGVVVDTFHLWWDPDVVAQIARAGRQRRIASYQIADWVTPLTADVLLSRGIPGDGSVDFTVLTRAVSVAGYIGDVECEVFRQDVWDANPDLIAARSRDAYRALVEPTL